MSKKVIICLSLITIILIGFIWFCYSTRPTKFQIGDCVVSENSRIFKILEVGELGSYKIMTYNCWTGSWTKVDGNLTKTDCFDLFKRCE